jgi:hypothetical protein
LHKLIWLYHFDNNDNLIIDHINGDKLDNRIENLRLATKTDNSRNRKKHSNNTSGYIGVTYYKRDGKYIAQISIDSNMIRIGKCDTAYDAHVLYVEYAKKQFGEFYRENS